MKWSVTGEDNATFRFRQRECDLITQVTY